MPDWPQPAPFDLPGAMTMVSCARCGATTLGGAEACVACGEPFPGAAPEPEGPRGARLRQRPRRRVAPTLSKAGWAKLVWLVRLVSALFLIWSVVDSGFWLNGITRAQEISDAAAMRYTLHAIYELVRNCVLVAALWLLTTLWLPVATWPAQAKDA